MDDPEVSPDSGEGEVVEPDPTEPAEGEESETPVEDEEPGAPVEG